MRREEGDEEFKEGRRTRGTEGGRDGDVRRENG